MSLIDRVLLSGSSYTEATFCSVVKRQSITGLVFLFCFVSVDLFLSGLTLIFGSIQCCSGLPDPLCGLSHKGGPAGWEQCPWSGH